MALAKIILREKIEGLGAEADVVKVRAGYARNFLIPRGKAYEASEENLKYVEDLNAARAAREAKELAEARELAARISKLRPVFTLQIGESGKAFGSVTALDIHKKLEEEGIQVDRRAIVLEKAIKHSGKSEVIVQVHPEITTTLIVNVTADEAEKATK